MLSPKEFNKDKHDPSAYMPPEDVRVFTQQIRDDYQIGDNIQNQQYAEFNDVNVLTKSEQNQKRFNSYVEPQSDNYEEKWHANTTRPISRQRVIGMAAQMTAQIVYPQFFAQDSDDNQDQEAANLMRTMVKWNIENSDYEISHLFGVISALVNPCAYFSVDYVEATQSIKVRLENGDITYKEILDEVLSGVKYGNIPVDEMLISNIYEYYHPKQRFRIRRRFIDYAEAKALFGDHDNFKFVTPGVKIFYNDDKGQFYQQYDEENQSLVEHVNYQNRQGDVEVNFINGVYLGDGDVNDNMIKHRRYILDNTGEPVSVPVYGEAKFGFEPLDAKRFYYYKSAVDKVGPEQDLLDRMWRMVLDGTALSVMPPVITSGGDMVDSSVILPGAVTSLEEETRVDALNVGNNLNSGYAAVQELERSINDSTQDPIRGGTATSGDRTAFEVSRIEENAKITASIFGRMIAEATVEVGQLLSDVVLQHQSVAQLDELLDSNGRMKFRQFILDDEDEDGRKIKKIVRFKEDLIGARMSEDQKEKREKRLFAEAGGLESNISIIEANPYKFASRSYKAIVKADQIFPRSMALEKAFDLEGYDRMINNPFTNPEAVTRDFLVKNYAKGDVDKYMKKAQEAGVQDILGGQQEPQLSSLVQQATGSNSLNALLGQ